MLTSYVVDMSQALLLILIISAATVGVQQSFALSFDPFEPFESHGHHHFHKRFRPPNDTTKTSTTFDYTDLNITRYPVVLIPGDGGNQLHGKLNKTSAPHYFCKLQSADFFEIWLNLEEITPYVIDCFIDNIRLVYDNETKRTFNRQGVDIEVRGFGNTDTVEFLDSSRYSITMYFGAIANALVKKYGYVRGVNIRGAPYDWRKAPNELADYYKNLTLMVEQTYEANNKTPIILIAHSMGNPVSLYWLNNLVTQEWKDKYIKSFVSLAGVWGGAAKTVRLMTSGDNIDVIVVSPIKVRPYQRTAVSTAFLMPSDRFWAKDEVILSRPTRNYTVNDYEQLFLDIGFENGYEMRKNTEKLVYDLKAPHVELHCLYGVGLKTPEVFVYTKEKDFPDSQPSVIYGDGDGTVNVRSLRGHTFFQGQQSQPIYVKEFPGVEHVATLRYQPIIDYILALFVDQRPPK